MGSFPSASARIVLSAALAVGLTPSPAIAEPFEGAERNSATQGVAASVEGVALAEPGSSLDSAAEGMFVYELNSDGDATIMGLAEGVEAVDLVIPSEIDGHPVNCIGESAFEGNGMIESVAIPDGVELVGSSAFGECGMLSSISFPETPFSLGDSVFQGCSSLKEVIIPASLRSVGAGGLGAFYRSAVQNVVFEEGVSKIPDYCMQGAGSLSSVVIPESVIEIGARAFFQCYGLEEIAFPESLVVIGESSFGYCDSLRSVIFPRSLESIGGQAFRDSGLTGVEIKGDVSQVGYYAFSDCGSLRSASVDTDVSCEVENNAFSDCSMLTDLYLSPFVSSVSDSAFSNTPLQKVSGYPGSYAQAFATENGFAFETLDGLLNLDRAAIVQGDAALIYQGAPVVPEWFVSYGTLSLQEGRDYSVSYEGNESAGTATARFSGTGLFRGEVVREFAISDPAEIADYTLSVDDEPLSLQLELSNWSSVEWVASDWSIVSLENPGISMVADSSGSRIVATIDVVPLNPGLVEVNAIRGSIVLGSATVLVTSSTRVDIAQAEVTGIDPSYEFVGSVVTPIPTVKIGETTLVQDVDYALSFENLDSVGTATIVISGMGDYRGEIRIDYQITPGDVSKWVVAPIADVPYMGGPVEPVPEVMEPEGVRPFVDFSLEYGNNDSIGTATAVIKGEGNWSGELRVPFEIVAPEPEPEPGPGGDSDPDPDIPDPDPGTDPDAPAPVPVSFTDVTDSTDHAPHIRWLAEEGISKGWPNGDGTFRYEPYLNVARADMAAFLYRLAGSPAFEPGAEDLAAFEDVGAGTPHCKEVLWLASAGISEGWDVGGGDREFRPYAEIARSDMAAFLHRLAICMGAPDPGSGGMSFSDVDASIAHSGDVAWLSAAGITTGFPDGTFRPYDTIVRCDMSAMLHRLDGLVEGYEVA